MKKRSKFFVANIVLGSIFAVFLLVSVVMTILFHMTFQEVENEIQNQDWNSSLWDFQDESDLQYYFDYAQLSILDIQSELLGDTYQGYIADDGYQLYMIYVEVKNESLEYENAPYLPIYAKGEKYDDVYEEDLTNQSGAFGYDNLELIPAGRTGMARMLVQVKDGVDSIELEYYTDLGDETEIYEVDLR